MAVKMKLRTLSESVIIRDVAEAICQRCVNSIRRSLQRMPSQLSGDDSGLHTVWEEICVQVQEETSIYWDVYEETMRAFVDAAVEDLAQFEQEAVWLQTDAALDWECDEDRDRRVYPVFAADIVDFIMSEHLLAEAGRWSNPRIRTYIDRANMRD